MILRPFHFSERSQRGDRDSELAAVVRDTDLIEGYVIYDQLKTLSDSMFSTMAGKPFKVGRFAHTLRVRLMREHLGVDVDALYEEDFEQQPDSTEQPPNHENVEKWDPDHEQEEISPEHPKLEKEKISPIKGETSAAARLLQTASANIKQSMVIVCSYSI
jgi:phospholipase D1/2